MTSFICWWYFVFFNLKHVWLKNEQSDKLMKIVADQPIDYSADHLRLELWATEDVTSPLTFDLWTHSCTWASHQYLRRKMVQEVQIRASAGCSAAGERSITDHIDPERVTMFKVTEQQNRSNRFHQVFDSSPGRTSASQSEFKFSAGGSSPACGSVACLTPPIVSI